MPKISEFFGISIYMYFDDHHPAHFHARYQGLDMQVDINRLRVMRGRLSPRAMGLVMEWAARHQKALMKAWAQAVANEKIRRIEPLK